ncbi:MAG: DUF924 family protein [Parvularculaceae bacterium]
MATAEYNPASKNPIKSVLDFWFVESGASKWFKGGPDFDAEITRRFSEIYSKAKAEEFNQWRDNAEGALALILILDQFSRNMFRADARAFACDDYAREVARKAIGDGFDKLVAEEATPFVYMPFMHSEDLDDQNYCVELFEKFAPLGDNLRFAILHRDIIAQFGRFPHRNEALGRKSTPEETAYLEQGGFKG